MVEQGTISLVIQPTVAVRRHLVANGKWIVWSFVIIAFFVVVSAIGFHYAEQGYLIDGKPHNGWFDSVYFTIINVTTVGFGDIAPQSDGGKILAMLNSILGVIIFGVLVTILTTALQPGEFIATATGAVINPIPPPEPKIPSGQNTEEKKAEEAVDLFLRGLGGIVGENKVKDRHVYIRVRDNSDPDETISVLIDIHIDRPRSLP